MNDMTEYFPTDEQIEARAVARTFELIAVAGDAKAAQTRLEKIVAPNTGSTKPSRRRGAPKNGAPE